MLYEFEFYYLFKKYNLRINFNNSVQLANFHWINASIQQSFQLYKKNIMGTYQSSLTVLIGWPRCNLHLETAAAKPQPLPEKKIKNKNIEMELVFITAISYC